jgi:hypothetical protein
LNQAKRKGKQPQERHQALFASHGRWEPAINGPDYLRAAQQLPNSDQEFPHKTRATSVSLR